MLNFLFKAFLSTGRKYIDFCEITGRMERVFYNMVQLFRGLENEMVSYL